MNGKGSKKRPRCVSKEVEEANYTRIFGAKKPWWELRDIPQHTIPKESSDASSERSETHAAESCPAND